MEHVNISIKLPYENCINTHSVDIPFKGDEEPLAEEVLKKHITLLMENIYGEEATRNAFNKV